MVSSDETAHSEPPRDSLPAAAYGRSCVLDNFERQEFEKIFEIAGRQESAEDQELWCCSRNQYPRGIDQPGPSG